MSIHSFIHSHHLCPHWGSHQPMCVCVCVWCLITCVFTERVKWGRMGLSISRKALNHHVVYGSGKRKCSHLENLGALNRMTSSCWQNLIYVFTGYYSIKPLAAWPRLGYVRPNYWNLVEKPITPLDFFFRFIRYHIPWELHFSRSFAEFSPFGKTLKELSHSPVG